MHQFGGGPCGAQALDRACPGVGRAVIDHPEHPFGAGVGLDGHDLIDQRGEWGDAGGGLHPAHQLSAVHVIGPEVGQGAVPLILELDPTGAPRARGELGVTARQSLQLRPPKYLSTPVLRS